MLRDRIYLFFQRYAEGEITDEILYRVLDRLKSKPVVLIKARQALENLFTDGGIDLQRFQDALEYIDVLRGIKVLPEKEGAATTAARERTARAAVPVIDEGVYRPGKGQVVGHYQLLRSLGSGGMGEVWLACDLGLICEQWGAELELTAGEREEKDKVEDGDGLVVVKFISEDFREDPDSWRVFKSEFRKYRKLNHSSIVRAFELDRIGDRGFIVMEYVAGISLREVLDSHPEGLPYEQVRQMMSPVCDALEYAHRGRDLSRRGYSGMIHSDLKPSNILYDQSNSSVKLIDFGIAQHLLGEDRLRTVFRGGINAAKDLGALSEPYASLEMFWREDPEPTDDVYGLACITYELLTGSHPFGGKGAELLFEENSKGKVAKIDPPATLGRQQWEVLQRALALRRQDRVQTVAEFKAGLFAEATAVANATAAPTVSAPRYAALGKSVGGVVVLGVLLGGGYWIWDSKGVLSEIDGQAKISTSIRGQAGSGESTVEGLLSTPPFGEPSVTVQCNGRGALGDLLSCIATYPDTGDAVALADYRALAVSRILAATAALSLHHDLARLREAEEWLRRGRTLGLEKEEREYRHAIRQVDLLLEQRVLLELLEGESVDPATTLTRLQDMTLQRLHLLFDDSRMISALIGYLARSDEPISAELLAGYRQLFASHASLTAALAEAVRQIPLPELDQEVLQQQFFSLGSACEEMAAIAETLEQLERSGVTQSTRILGEWCRRRLGAALRNGERERAEQALAIWMRWAAEDQRYLNYITEDGKVLF